MNAITASVLLITLVLLSVILARLNKKESEDYTSRWGSNRQGRRFSQRQSTYDPSYCQNGTLSCIKKCGEGIECKIECLERCPEKTKETWRGWGWRRPWAWGWRRPWGIAPCQARSECKKGCDTGCDNTTEIGTKEHQKCVHTCSETCDSEYPC